MVMSALSVSVGSSPRGRGTRTDGTEAPERPRFIPARAGNTSDVTPRSTQATVHPRAGGEHVDIADGDIPIDGSSPRGRGTLAKMNE